MSAAPAGTSAPAPFLSQSARVTCIPCGRGLSTVGSEGCRRWNCVRLHGREGCRSRPRPHSRVTQGALDPAGTPAPPQGSQPRTLGWGLGSVPSWFSAVIVPGAPWMFHHERVGHRWSSSLPGAVRRRGMQSEGQKPGCSLGIPTTNRAAGHSADRNLPAADFCLWVGSVR